jgi:lipopolysaccharide assembly protein A
MQFLKTLFWVTVAVSAAIFSFNNWSPVTINLWNGLQLDTRLPLLLMAAFLIGLVPALLLHRTTRWRLRRKIETMERALTDIRVATEPAPTTTRVAIPPAAAPMAVPPGVA